MLVPGIWKQNWLLARSYQHGRTIEERRAVRQLCAAGEQSQASENIAYYALEKKKIREKKNN